MMMTIVGVWQRRRVVCCWILLWYGLLVPFLDQDSETHKNYCGWNVFGVEAFSPVVHPRSLGQSQQQNHRTITATTTRIPKRGVKRTSTSPVRLKISATDAYLSSLSEYAAQSSTIGISKTESYLNSLSRLARDYQHQGLLLLEQNHALAAAASSSVSLWSGEDSFLELEDGTSSGAIQVAKSMTTASLVAATTDAILDTCDDDTGMIPGTATIIQAKKNWVNRLAVVKLRALQAGTNYMSRQSSPAYQTARRTFDCYRTKYMAEIGGSSSFSFWPTSGVSNTKLPSAAAAAVSAGEKIAAGAAGTLTSLSETIQTGLQELGSLLVLLLGVMVDDEDGATVGGGTTTATTRIPNLIYETQNSVQGIVQDTSETITNTIDSINGASSTFMVSPDVVARNVVSLAVLVSRVLLRTLTVVFDLVVVAGDGARIPDALQSHAVQLTAAAAAAAADWNNDEESFLKLTTLVRSLLAQVAHVMVATGTSAASASSSTTAAAALEILEEVSSLSQSI